MSRQPGLLGRKAPKRAPVLRLGRLLTGTVPEHPVATDYLAAMRGGWQMLGNGPDPANAAAGVPAYGAGDCVSVTWANQRRLVTATVGDREYYPTLEQVVEFYKTQNPGFPEQDNGMDVQTACEELQQNGGPDGVKAVAFAQVDPTNADEVKAAIAIFGFVWTGVNVLDVNMRQFGAYQPWDFDPSSPMDGGHSVLTAGYGTGGAGALGGDEKFITWAEETSFTDTYWTNEVEETYAVIWPEHLGTRSFEQGVDRAALASDFEAITGRVLQLP